MAWAKDFFLLDLHLERTEASADYFGFRFERESVREQLYNFAKGLQRGPRHRVRLLLARSGVASISSEPIPAVRKPASLLVSAERRIRPRRCYGIRPPSGPHTIECLPMREPRGSMMRSSSMSGGSNRMCHSQRDDREGQ
jgi:hypothetical protein